MLKVHIICAKCGSANMQFINERPSEEDSIGVSMRCTNCAELTSIEEWSEANHSPVIDLRKEQP